MKVPDKILSVIEERFAWCASWAVWADQGIKPTSNIGDTSVFDFTKRTDVRQKIHSEFIFIGLNVSKSLGENKYSNFHSNSPRAKDYKIRYAVRETPAWGGYMTDLIKNFPELESRKAINFIRNNPKFLYENIDILREEISTLDAEDAKLLCFGGDVFNILKNHFPHKKLIHLMHYSSYISKEHYRAHLIEKISGGE